MPVVRGGDRPTAHRPAPLPALQHLVDRQAGSEAVTVLVNTLSTAQRIPPHRHDVEEVLVIVDGSCTVRLGGETVTVAAGDAVIVPPGTEHSLWHAGTGEARVVAVLASPDVRIGG